MSSVGKQTFAQSDAVIASYSLKLGSPEKPTKVANNLVQNIGVSGSVTNLISPASGAPSTTDYRLFMGVAYGSSSDVVLLTAVVPDSVVPSYSHLATGTTSTTNVQSKGASRTSNTDTFTGSSGSGKADFLFVVDNSGSMGGEQTALSDAADEFETAINNSGLDYNLATITTDSDTLQDTEGDGKIVTASEDIQEFKDDVNNLGTGGSATETGIYFAEQALLDSSKGDSKDGTAVSAGMPRSNASLSVLIFSDEASQYTSRASSSFDPTANLFIDRGYKVHAIVDPGDASYSQYDELANNAGGVTADIGNNSNFPTIMQNIAQQAGGATSQFQLNETPIRSTISVGVNGNSVPNSSSDGWTYVQGSNAISFHGNAIPGGGDSIEVSYQYVASGSSSVVTAVDAVTVQ